ncbi:MAG: type II toxin-antitoxin system PemK/MazF family toxin [Deltaproteobacteria bacterium]|nr:type II toxin-antitoxin system PemK/MazF family toxin [Deltaproteobacteria bacterium]
MIKSGQVILFNFPQTNQEQGKLRPALLLEKTPGSHPDWLLCMISSQLHHEVKGFDETIHESDEDFSDSGLKTTSLIRIGRLAVVEENLLLGAIGKISSQRLKRIRLKLAKWIRGR